MYHVSFKFLKFLKLIYKNSKRGIFVGNGDSFYNVVNQELQKINKFILISSSTISQIDFFIKLKNENFSLEWKKYNSNK